MHTNAIIVVCHCHAYNKTPRPLKMQPIQWIWCGLTTPKHSRWNNNPIKVGPWSSCIHPIPTDHEDTHQCQRTNCTCRGGTLPLHFEIVRCHAWSFRVSLHDWVILRSSRGKKNHRCGKVHWPTTKLHAHACGFGGGLNAYFLAGGLQFCWLVTS